MAVPGSDLLLQQTSDVAAGGWTTVTNSVWVTNLQHQFILTPLPANHRFYRLTR